MSAKVHDIGSAASSRRTALVRDAMTLDDRLDDVTRARIWTKLEDALAPAAAPRRSRAPVAVGVIVAAAAVAGVLVLRSGGGAREVDVRALVAPAETTVTATIGGHTHAALIGPARLEIVEQAGDATTVKLERGTMYASFEGGAGRHLRVVAPGAVVDVVGTLFGVEADGARTCVSVAHGRVRVTTGVRVALVGAGERLCTDGRRSAIDAQVAAGLAKQDSVSVTVPVPVTVPVSVPVSVPVTEPVTESVTEPVSVSDDHGHDHGNGHDHDHGNGHDHGHDHGNGHDHDHGESDGPPPPVPSDSGLYASAEAALASHDPAAADRALAELIRTSPSSPLLDQALYERARIAYQRHAWNEARRDLDALAAIKTSPLTEPGRYLACRIAVLARDGDAARCLADYRASYPGSPHEQDVLGLLAQLAFEGGGCAGARPYLDALAPGAALTTAWRTRCPEAAP